MFRQRLSWFALSFIAIAAFYLSGQPLHSNFVNFRDANTLVVAVHTDLMFWETRGVDSLKEFYAVGDWPDDGMVFASGHDSEPDPVSGHRFPFVRVTNARSPTSDSEDPHRMNERVIQGFRHLLKAHPNTPFFLKADDDTFASYRMLTTILKNFPHPLHQPHYIGRCGWANHTDILSLCRQYDQNCSGYLEAAVDDASFPAHAFSGPSKFAFGGPGYVLSNKAVRILLGAEDHCPRLAEDRTIAMCLASKQVYCNGTFGQYFLDAKKRWPAPENGPNTIDLLNHSSPRYLPASIHVPWQPGLYKQISTIMRARLVDHPLLLNP